MSLSLIAVFIPILLMGGIVGRLFREFAVTLSAAILRVAGRLADDDADDVRDACCGRRRRARAAGSTRLTERGFDGGRARLRAQPRLGAAARAAR